MKFTTKRLSKVKSKLKTQKAAQIVVKYTGITMKRLNASVQDVMTLITCYLGVVLIVIFLITLLIKLTIRDQTG